MKMSVSLAWLFLSPFLYEFIIRASDNDDQVKYHISIHQNYPEREKNTIQSHQLN